MLTPIDIQNKSLKAGRGYKKKDVDSFIAELFQDYEALYKKNLEQKDKISVLSEGIQYYKTMEKTMQGALLLAEKTAEESRKSADDKAAGIIENATNRARMIIADAKNELKSLETKSQKLIQEYEHYRLNFKHLLKTQLELLESDNYKLYSMTDTFSRLEEQALTEVALAHEDLNEEEPEPAQIAEEDEESAAREDDFSDVSEEEEEKEEGEISIKELLDGFRGEHHQEEPAPEQEVSGEREIEQGLQADAAAIMNMLHKLDDEEPSDAEAVEKTEEEH
ncbi:DivIVA domain-containing protein [Anaerolentibacter hominis]|uniref:DivIVA domain-containing protein n=1 Tax=Anaerolentibacter hominis TaxID=3079009 RepID=UPI0031B80FED